MASVGARAEPLHESEQINIILLNQTLKKSGRPGSAPVPQNGAAPGRRAEVRRPLSQEPQVGSASVRLAAQESRDLELIVIDLVMHRGCPAVLVEPLRNAAFGVFGDRLPARANQRHAARAASAARDAAAYAPAAGASGASPGARPAAAPPRAGQGRRRRGGRAATCAACRPDPASSPWLARIAFWAGSGNSSMRGMRGVREDRPFRLRRDEHLRRRGLAGFAPLAWREPARTATAWAGSAGW